MLKFILCIFLSFISIQSSDFDKENIVPLRRPTPTRRPTPIKIDFSQRPLFFEPKVKKIDKLQALRIELSQKYNPEIVAFWTAPKMYHRIQFHQESFNGSMDKHFVLRDILECDCFLQKFIVNQQKKYSNQAAFERDLLQILSSMKKKIEKSVEQGEVESSYQAWPLIKEIHTRKKFDTCWNANNLQP